MTNAERITEINAQCATLQQRLSALQAERRVLEMIEALDRYTCHCVNLNRKMGIADMGEQERRGRNALQLGIVSETLSASRSCPDCGGSGIPRCDR